MLDSYRAQSQQSQTRIAVVTGHRSDVGNERDPHRGYASKTIEGNRSVDSRYTSYQKGNSGDTRSLYHLWISPPRTGKESVPPA